MNEFTVALPISKEQIDEILELNKEVKKSKVTYFHSALPENLVENTGLEHNINADMDMTFHKFMNLVSYGTEKGIQFTYLLNGLKGFQLDNNSYTAVYNKLNLLIRYLREAGCRSIKVTNPSVMHYLRNVAPDFNLVLSTIAGYKDINQFRNLLTVFPEIKEIVMTTDSMKNIPLVKHLQDLGLRVIYMVNEGCLEGCPFRVGHYSYPLATYNPTIMSEYMDLEYTFFTSKCQLLKYRDFSEYVIKSNIIYPHQIEDYNKLGITKFKIAGRLTNQLKNGKQMQFIKDYLRAVDNPEEYMNMSFMYFNRSCVGAPNHIKEKYGKITVEELKQFLPDIKKFIKSGNECGVKCGFECKYCSDKALQFKKYVNGDQALDKNEN